MGAPCLRYRVTQQSSGFQVTDSETEGFVCFCVDLSIASQHRGADERLGAVTCPF
jgi:hypothetical protein